MEVKKHMPLNKKFKYKISKFVGYNQEEEKS